MGQICTATSRIFVQDTIYEKFLEAFHEQVKSSTVIGDPFDENTTHGPQVSKAQYEKILSLIESGKSEGAGLLTGGARSGDKGFYIQPTVFRDVKPNMKIVREEIFGPCFVIAPFSTEADAIERANDTEYGLGAAIFTENLRKAHRVAAGVQAGTVWVRYACVQRLPRSPLTFTCRSTALRTPTGVFLSEATRSLVSAVSLDPTLCLHTPRSRLSMVRSSCPPSKTHPRYLT